MATTLAKLPRFGPPQPEEPEPPQLSPVFMQEPADTQLARLPVMTTPPTVRQPTDQERNLDYQQAQLQKVREAQARPYGFKGAQPSEQFPQGLAPNHPSTMGKIAHVLSVAGNIAGNIVAPNVMANIPGTQAYNREREAELSGEVAKGQEAQSEEKLREAQTAESEARKKAQELVTISPEEAESMGNPSLAGSSVTQGVYQHLLTNAQTTASREKVAQMSNETKKDIADAQNLSREKLAQLKPEQRDDRAIRLMQKPPDQRTQEENAYLGAYSRWIDQTKVQPGIARAQAFGQFRPVQVVMPNGDVGYQFSGQAIAGGMKGPQSMDFRTQVKMMQYMTSGKGGSTLTAYRTATDHLDMLRDAATALENGDVQLLNKLSNRFKTEFGSAAPTNFETVKTMLAGELANVAKVTGATDPEIASYKAQLSAAQSPEQIQGVIETNQSLMDQKAQEMFLQHESGMTAQPNFGKGVTPSGGGAGTPPPGAKIIKWQDVK